MKHAPFIGDKYRVGLLADDTPSDSVVVTYHYVPVRRGCQMSATTVTPEVTKSLGQTYYEELQELNEAGVANGDAMRQIAEKHGKSMNSVRGGIYQYRTRLSGGTSNGRSRQRPATSVEDLVGQARASVEHALGLIDQEVAEAKAQYDAAKLNYEQLQASVSDRKADLTKKLKALS